MEISLDHRLPLFEWSESDKQWVSAQTPFTGIVDEDLEKLESAPWESAQRL